MTRACGAARPAVHDAGWECTGSGLIVITRLMDGLPVVLPARALDVIEPESWWESPIVPFAGGDHMHLVVPRRPGPPNPSLGVMIFSNGDAAIPFSKIGFGDGDEIFIGGNP